jgi:predicted Abi (CAAX) family protease
MALLAPALVEEALFRAALLPHPAVDPPAAWATLLAFAARAALPLAAFVAYHLANPRPQSRRLFSDVRVLSLAGLLGAACSVVYWVTGGSLAAAAVVHWLPVCVWLFGLGGFQALGYGGAADVASGVCAAVPASRS